jgi:uncharacterized protein involved in type VI secretion and phage assembly
MSLERIVADLVQKIEQRFYGKYRGFVVDNTDPEQLGRLKLRVPSVLGNDVVTGWAMPCTPYGGDPNQGFLFIPDKDAGVWVEFEEGDLEFPIWVGTFWSKPGGESELPKPNDADGTEQGSIQDPLTCKIIKTKKGHTIQLEDKDDEEMIMVKEAQNGHVITLNKDGIKITDGANGHEVILDDTGITISDKKNVGNEIKMDDQGMICKDKNGNQVTMSASSGFPSGPGIDLNGGKRVCLEGLINWLLSHKHIGNMGAPTPLSPDNIAQLTQALTSPGSGILSDTVKAK